MPTDRRNVSADDDWDDGGKKRSVRRRAMGVSSVLVGVVFVLRVVVFFVQLHHSSAPPPAVAVSFPDPFATPTPLYDPAGLPDLDGTDFPSDAPTVSPLGPVTYVVTGDGNAAYVDYTVTETSLPRQTGHRSLPFRKTVKGGFNDYFTVAAGAGSGTTITCKIIAKNGKVEKQQTARGRHAKVYCEWEPSF